MKNRILLVLSMLSISCSAQIAGSGAWIGYEMDKRIYPVIDYTFFIQYRSSDSASDPSNMLLFNRLKLIPFKNGLSFGAYYYSLSPNFGKSEHDIIPSYKFLGEEIGYIHTIKHMRFCYKLKLEQVWKDRADFYQQGRLFTSIKLPLVDNNENVYFMSSTELFWKINEKSYNRNRVTLGIGFNIGNHLQIQPGMVSEKFHGYSRNHLNIMLKHILT